MSRFLVDSDIIISFTKHHPGALETLSEVSALEESTPSAVSAVTVFEVLQGLRQPEKPAIRRLFGTFRCMPVTGTVAHAAALLVRRQRTDGRQLSMGDALIAATALINDLVVVTENTKHYESLGVRLYGKGPTGAPTKQEG